MITLVQKGLYNCKPRIASLGILRVVPICCSVVSFFLAAFTPHFRNVPTSIPAKELSEELW